MFTSLGRKEERNREHVRENNSFSDIVIGMGVLKT